MNKTDETNDYIDQRFDNCDEVEKTDALRFWFSFVDALKPVQKKPDQGRGTKQHGYEADEAVERAVRKVHKLELQSFFGVGWRRKILPLFQR